MPNRIILLPTRCPVNGCLFFEGKAIAFWELDRTYYPYLVLGDGIVQCPVCQTIYDTVGQSPPEPGEPEVPSITIQNPSMEGAFPKRIDPEVKIAEGWNEWYTQKALWPGVVNRPEWGPETVNVGRGRVHSGNYAQKMFTVESLHRAGITQQVASTPGKWYKLTAWVWVWSSSQNNPDTSNGKLHARLGINPWGGGPDHYASVYGMEALEYDKWVKLEVYAQAFGGTITLFCESMPEFTVAHNDTYWDDFALEELDSPTEPPTVEPPTGPPVAGECLFDDSAIMLAVANVSEQLDQVLGKLATGTNPDTDVIVSAIERLYPSEMSTEKSVDK